MRGLNERYAVAVAAIDAANGDDLTSVTVRGVASPLALAHGRLAVEWVELLAGSPSEALLLAARAHHLRRWEVPRATYPEGRGGYLRWRVDQKARHATEVEGLLRGVGYDDATIARVRALVRREGLATDTETQTLEDAACLVFIETQLAELAGRLERDHLLTVIRKTARKMSVRGRDAVGKVPLGDVEREILTEALGP